MNFLSNLHQKYINEQATASDYILVPAKAAKNVLSSLVEIIKSIVSYIFNSIMSYVSTNPQDKRNYQKEKVRSAMDIETNLRQTEIRYQDAGAEMADLAQGKKRSGLKQTFDSLSRKSDHSLEREFNRLISWVL